MVAVFGAIGYLGPAEMGSPNFGAYSANLLALVNPMDYSRLLPPIDVPTEQWEGFAYLGAGGLALVALAAGVVVLRRPSTGGRQAWPVLAATLLMAAYAVSSVVTVGSREVLRVDWLTPAVTPFRSSGRFIWSLHYLLLLLGIWGATRAAGRGRQAVATTVLAGAVVLQAADIKVDSFWLGWKGFRRPPSPTSGSRSVTSATSSSPRCRCSTRAAASTTSITSTVTCMSPTASTPPTIAASSPGFLRRRSSRSAVGRAAGSNEASSNRETLYVVRADWMPLFERAMAACGQFGDDWLCVSRDSYEPFRRYLLENGRLPLVR